MPAQRYGITSVSIRDFRGIESLDLDFRDPSGQPNRVVVLAGPNGCGKTAVLEACLLAMGRENDPLLQGSPRSASSRIGGGDFAVTAGCIDSKGAIEVYALPKGSSSNRPLTAEDSQYYRLSWYRTTFPRLTLQYFPSRRESLDLGPVKLKLESGSSDSRSTRRHSHTKDFVRTVKEEIVNARAHELLVGDRNDAELRSAQLLDRIAKTWGAFFPGDGFEVRPVGSDPRLGFDVFLVRGNKRLPIRSLSSGELQVFLLAGTLALDKPSTGIIFIDEPELHLDPQWHAVILRVLMEAQPECQFIIGTHSPEIYDSVMSYERHFLVPADDPRAKLWHVKEPREGAA